MEELLNEVIKYYEELQSDVPDNLSLPNFHKAMGNLIVYKNSNQLEPPTNNDCEHLYVSEFDYYGSGVKKYYHIKIINKTEKFIEFEWIGSGTKQLMPLKTFNEVFTIEEKLQ